MSFEAFNSGTFDGAARVVKITAVKQL